MDNTIGIDHCPVVAAWHAMRGISKDTLDVHCLSDGEHTQFLNSKTGHVQLTKWIELQPASVIIFEGEAERN